MAAIPTESTSASEVAWRLVYLSRAHLTSLEATALAVLAIIVGGMVAVWTAIHEFESGVPRSLCYAAWAILVV
jgi:hypothetical protein